MAEARVRAAELEHAAAEQRSDTIILIGEAEARAIAAKLEAQNKINKVKMQADFLEQLLVQLPDIIERLMKPAEKIDNIRVLQVNGLEGTKQRISTDDEGRVLVPSPGGNVLDTLMNVGLALPMIQEIIKHLRADENYQEIFEVIKSAPGAETLLKQVESRINHKE